MTYVVNCWFTQNESINKLTTLELKFKRKSDCVLETNSKKILKQK
jgi:hypothetical protein